MKKKLTIVVPFLNEEDNLRNFNIRIENIRNEINNMDI